MIDRSLRGTQLWMIGAIVENASDEEVRAMLTPGPRLSALDRLDIYRRGYHARLEECLADDYPILADTIGHAAFHELSRAYVTRHPSTSPSLNSFGRHMASFCKEGGSTILGDRAAFLSDLARLEWALVEVLHAEVAPPIELAKLAEIAPEAWATARLVPMDALRILRLEHPVNAFYQARKEGREAEIPAPSPSAVAVYRRDTELWRMDLTPPMTRVLSALVEGAPLADALANVAVDETDEAAIEVAQATVMVWFREWMDAGMFRAVELA